MVLAQTARRRRQNRERRVSYTLIPAETIGARAARSTTRGAGRGSRLRPLPVADEGSRSAAAATQRMASKHRLRRQR